MANIEKRVSKDGQKSYRVKVRIRGARPESASFDTLTDARKWGQQTEANIRQRRYFPTTEARKHTLADLIDRYVAEVLPKKPKDLRNRTRQLNWWKSKLGAIRLSDIGSPELSECKRKLALENIAPTGKPEAFRAGATVTRYLSALSHVFRIAVREWHWMEDNPMRNVSKPTADEGVVRFLDNDERDRLLAQCKKSKCPELYLLVVLALSTGARKAELAGLRWSQVDISRRSITLTETKNGSIRALPLVSHALQLMVEHNKVRRIDTDLVFPSRINPKKPKELPKPLDFRTPWETALKRAGIENFRWHDLRHTCASYLAMNGASMAEIAEVLGHKTLQMVKRYTHLSAGHVSSVVESMNQKVFG